MSGSGGNECRYSPVRSGVRSGGGDMVDSRRVDGELVVGGFVDSQWMNCWVRMAYGVVVSDPIGVGVVIGSAGELMNDFFDGLVGEWVV